MPDIVRTVFAVARPRRFDRAVPWPVPPCAELLTVEGERDDICWIEQTAAVHHLCKGLRPHLRRYRLQAGVRHYGMLSGKRWHGQIYPVIRNLVLEMY